MLWLPRRRDGASSSSAPSFLIVIVLLVSSAAFVLGQVDQFKPFLLKNMLPTMPRSFAIWPNDYFEKVPPADRPHHYTTSHYIPSCNNWSIPATRMNDYMFQTEALLTGLGLNIYDGAVWCIALSVLNETQTCASYIQDVLVAHRTVQFPDIRGDAQCKGAIEYGQCSDPTASGVCGFCYGDTSDRTLTVQNAYFFRMISDYWAIEGTVDARCPELKHEWTWNDYKPILGENAWAVLLGPLHNAMMRAGNDPTKIPDSDPCFTLGIPFLQALEAMKIGTTGAIYYTPRNTWFGFGKTAQNIGSTFSVENQASLLAGLEALNWTISMASSQTYKSYLPQIAGFINGLKTILLRAYDKTHNYFRQGGTYDPKTGGITWGQNNEPLFAVDCQTWVSAVLGTQLIDGTFGAGTAYNLWQTVKLHANYSCPDGSLCGVGYTDNTISGQVLSGEWTYGAMNWINVMIADSGYDAAEIADLQNDLMNLEFGLETYVWVSTPVSNSTESYNSVKYADRRYWIPFGWYANPLPATSSTAWATLYLAGFNPFNVDKGKYTRSYSSPKTKFQLE